MSESSKRFRVALSFAGEKRDYVEKVAAILAMRLGESAILYDKYHESEFAIYDLGIRLPILYGEQSELIVPILCPRYDEKRWTGWEWVHISGLLNKMDGHRVMPCRFKRAKANGLPPDAGFIDLDGKTPEETAKLILERLALNEGHLKDHYTKSTPESGKRPRSATGMVSAVWRPVWRRSIRARILTLVMLCAVSAGWVAVYFWHRRGMISKEENSISPIMARLPFPIEPRLKRDPSGWVLTSSRAGFIDTTGNRIFSLSWDEVDSFSEGFASVKIGGKWSCINSFGVTVIPPRWDDSYRFSEGLAVVREGDKYGFIDTGYSDTKRPVIIPQYDEAHNFSEGLARVQRNGKWTFVRHDGKPIKPMEWDRAGDFCEGRAPVMRNGTYAYINEKGDSVVSTTSQLWLNALPFSGDRALVQTLGGLWHYIDSTGMPAIQGESYQRRSFSQGLAFSGFDGNLYLIERTRGDTINQTGWEDARSFSGNMARVSNGSKWGLVDRSGSLVLKLEWDLIEDFRGADGRTYFRLCRVKPDSVAPKQQGESVAAEVIWIDSSLKEFWHSQ